MNPGTLKALKASIAHWERIVAGEEASAGGSNCALCQHFGDFCFISERGAITEVCPVSLVTGDEDCEGSPYHNFVHQSEKESRAKRINQDGYYRIQGPESLIAAQAELAFLQSLLPEENSNEQV